MFYNYKTFSFECILNQFTAAQCTRQARARVLFNFIFLSFCVSVCGTANAHYKLATNYTHFMDVFTLWIRGNQRTYSFESIELKLVLFFFFFRYLNVLTILFRIFCFFFFFSWKKKNNRTIPLTWNVTVCLRANVLGEFSSSFLKLVNTNRCWTECTLRWRRRRRIDIFEERENNSSKFGNNLWKKKQLGFCYRTNWLDLCVFSFYDWRTWSIAVPAIFFFSKKKSTYFEEKIKNKQNKELNALVSFFISLNHLFVFCPMC